jgi:hypothetical protein
VHFVEPPARRSQEEVAFCRASSEEEPGGGYITEGGLRGSGSRRLVISISNIPLHTSFEELTCFPAPREAFLFDLL